MARASFSHNLRDNFSQTFSFCWILKDHAYFDFTLCQTKIMASFSQKVQKTLFWSYFYYCWSFFFKMKFFLKTSALSRKRSRNIMARFRKKYVSSEKSYGRMDFRPWVGIQKRKKDAEQCTKRFCLKIINYFINKQMSSSATKIIGNVSICTVTVSSKSRKNSVQLPILGYFIRQSVITYIYNAFY